MQEVSHQDLDSGVIHQNPLSNQVKVQKTENTTTHSRVKDADQNSVEVLVLENVSKGFKLCSMMFTQELGQHFW